MIVAAMLRPGIGNELRGLARRDVLDDDAQPGKVADDLRELAIDEHALAIEHVDVRIGHFAVDA